MAFFIRRRKTGKVTVYYWDSKKRKQRAVSRDQTAHLDGLPNEQIEAWVRGWEERSGHKVDAARRRTVWSSDEVLSLFKAYQQDHLALASGNIKLETQRGELSRFQRYTLAYFVGVHEVKNPVKWDSLIPRFRAWLSDQGLDIRMSKKILFSLRRFGAYLVEQRVIEHPWLVRIPKRNRNEVTPLTHIIKPVTVLKAAKTLKSLDPRLALIVLLGYFASLRPGETYALEKEDFLTGAAAVKASRTYARFRTKKLGAKLTLLITKSMSRGKAIDRPKTHYSYGPVTVWDTQAAREIAAIVRELPKGRLMVYKRDHLNRLYADHIKPLLGEPAHGLRRASGFYLGRVKDVSTEVLQDHFRHSDIATTQLYTRRPVEEAKRVAKQDFDDVG